MFLKIPYGLIHFGGPFVTALVIFFFAPPGTVPVFARSFGYTNLIGVIIQLLFPTSPPWYENDHGMEPANYSMSGSPGGLARIDVILGLNLYSSNFSNAPLVFGAFPSLHSACAVVQVLFLSYVFPKVTPFLIGYALWIWWATMYLTHHYFIDLIAGAILSSIIFFVAKRNFLPKMQNDKESRWAYDYIEMGLMPTTKARLTRDFTVDAEEWSLGASSSIESGNVSPIENAASDWEIETLADMEEANITR